MTFIKYRILTKSYCIMFSLYKVLHLRIKNMLQLTYKIRTSDKEFKKSFKLLYEDKKA